LTKSGLWSRNTEGIISLYMKSGSVTQGSNLDNIFVFKKLKFRE